MKLELCHIGQVVGITVNGDKYIGEVVEIKIDNVNGKHSTVFKNDDGYYSESVDLIKIEGISNE